MRWTGNVARTEKIAYKIFVRKPEETRSRRREDNIKTDLREDKAIWITLMRFRAWNSGGMLLRWK
jgi:hypothetical protein